MKTTLLIMAAGIGSRFGTGIKQLEPVDDAGHIIMDYSIHDAIEAGFNHVVFIIRKDIEEEFRIRKSTVTGILKLLEKNGFIRRESVPQDARLKRIVPTARAESLRPQILEQLGRTEALLMEGIPEQELHIWRSVMCRMFGNLVKAEEEASKTNKNIKEEEEKDE